MYTIITSFNQKYWEEIANESVKFLDKNWPATSKIILYHELKNIPNINLSDRVSWKSLYDSCFEINNFVEKWKNEPKANGNFGTKFRLNAIKFVHKTFAIWTAARNINEGWLIWLDCDALVYNPIDSKFISNVFNDDKLISYVGRPGRYSECGFLAFNLNNPKTKEFLNEWENLYLSGDFIHLPETHDSWTFDYIRKKWDDPNLFLDLNKDTSTSKNPFGHSKLGPYIKHAKGDNKSGKLEKIKRK